MIKATKIKSPIQGVDWYVSDIIPGTKLFVLANSKTNDSLKQKGDFDN